MSPANCICETHYLALDGLGLNAVHKQSSKEKKSWQNWDYNSVLLGGKHECFLCAASWVAIGMILFSQASTIFKKSQSTNFNYGALTKLASVDFYQYAPNSSANCSSADWLMLFGERVLGR